MKRRFVVAVEGLAKEDEKTFTSFVRGKGLGWWHRVPNVWLLAGKTDTSTDEIIEKLKELAPDQNVLVLEFPEDITWSAYGDPNQFSKWLETTWAP